MHKATTRFWKYFDAFPKEVQQRAREQFEILKSNPYHPSDFPGSQTGVLLENA